MCLGVGADGSYRRQRQRNHFASAGRGFAFLPRQLHGQCRDRGEPFAVGVFYRMDFSEDFVVYKSSFTISSGVQITGNSYPALAHTSNKIRRFSGLARYRKFHVNK